MANFLFLFLVFLQHGFCSTEIIRQFGLEEFFLCSINQFVQLYKRFKYFLTLCQTIPSSKTLQNKAFENIVGKGENAGNQHFLLFPQCFLPYLTLSQTSPGFYMSPFFSFSHSVFYPFVELSGIFIKLRIVVCKFIKFGRF